MSCKRKQLDPDEVLEEDDLLSEQPIENEYEHLDDDDEEEDEETINKKKAEVERILRAQEPSSITQCDSIKITPFNLEEELEDGEFDASGNFIFKKEKTDDENHDTWAESVDWEAVEKKSSEKKDKSSINTSLNTQKSDLSLQQPARDKMTCYKTILRLMKPNETVQKAIKRLGNDIPKKKIGKHKLDCSNSSTSNSTNTSNIEEIRRNLNLVIDIAHQLLEEGDMDIYQKSYEDLEEAIN